MALIAGGCADRVAESEFTYKTSAGRAAGLADVTGTADAIGADVKQPDTEQPDTEQPDTEQPDTEQPDTDQADTDQADTDQADTAAVDATPSDVSAADSAHEDGASANDTAADGETHDATGDAGLPSGDAKDGDAATADASLDAVGADSTGDAAPAADASAQDGGQVDGAAADDGGTPDSGGPCSGKTDGAACAAAEPCFTHICTSGECQKTAKSCDDSKICTDDSCVPKVGCQHKDNGKVCACKQEADCAGLGNKCTGALSCLDLKCTVTSSNAVKCDSSKDLACAKSTCQPTTGVCAIIASQDGTTCDDNNTCTGGDACKAGTCVGAAKPGTCDDGKSCTTADTCIDGACAGKAKDCSDGEVCTTDSCDESLLGACAHLPNKATCDDANACTTGDTCDNKACKAGATPLSCDDKNPCTQDSCDPKSGCKSSAAIALEGALCGAAQYCKAGTCTQGCPDAKACDDANVCTTESCVKAQCQHDANTSACDDGQTCTQGDTCGDKACKGGDERFFLKSFATDGVENIAQTVANPMGGLISLGTSFIGTADFIVLLTDNLGHKTKLWSYGGAGAQHGSSIAAAPDGGVDVCGTTNVAGVTTHNDVLVARFDLAGKLLWKASQATTNNQWCRRVLRMPGGDTIVFGGTQVAPGNDGSRDLLLVAYDSDGKLRYQETHDVLGISSYDYDQDIAVTTHGRLVLCAQSFAGNGNGRYNALLLMVDPATGVGLKSNNSNSGGDNDDACRLVVPRPGGGVLMVGIQPGGAGQIPWLIQTDEALKTSWSKTLPAFKEFNPVSATALANGGVTLAGNVHEGADSLGFFGLLDIAGGWIAQHKRKGAGSVYFRSAVAMGDGTFAGPVSDSGAATKSTTLGRWSPWAHLSCKEAGQCAEPKNKDCSDGLGCTYDSCDATAGCDNKVVLADGSLCADGEPCTVGQTCATGTCQGGGNRLYARSIAGTGDEPHAAIELDDGSVAWFGTHKVGNADRGFMRRYHANGSLLAQRDYDEGTNTSIAAVTRAANGQVVACGYIDNSGGLIRARLFWHDGDGDREGSEDYLVNYKSSQCIALHGRKDGKIAFMGRQPTSPSQAFYYLVGGKGETVAKNQFTTAESILSTGFAASVDESKYILFGRTGTDKLGYGHWWSTVAHDGTALLQNKTAFNKITGDNAYYQRYGGGLGHKTGWLLTGQREDSGHKMRAFVQYVGGDGKQVWLAEVAGVTNTDMRGLVPAHTGDAVIATGSMTDAQNNRRIALLTADFLGKAKSQVWVGHGKQVEVFGTAPAANGDLLIPAAVQSGDADVKLGAYELRVDLSGNTACK